MKTFAILAIAFICAAGVPVRTWAEPSLVMQAAPAPEKNTAIEITAYDNRIKVANAPVGSVLEIYSVVGIKVKEIAITQPTAEYTVNIAKGYYIIRVGEIVRKVAIR